LLRRTGRNNLQILGLALLVSGDFQVPLFHALYPGNHNDPTSFRSVVHELVTRYRLLRGGAEDVTLVFDKGDNTEDTLEVLAPPFQVVGSLVPGHHPDLLAAPRQRFRRLDARTPLPGTRGLPEQRRPCRRYDDPADGDRPTR
jgi:hypothetical protein